MHVTDLVRYPVKSLRGHALDSAAIEPRGIAGDRRWMLVDAGGRFVTRREVPAMAAIDVAVVPGGLAFSHPHAGSCTAAVPPPGTPAIEATVWRDTIAAMTGNPAADAFLSGVVGRAVRLVYQFDDSRRAVHPAHALAGDHVSLADGFPLLVTTAASLDALNDRLARRVTMARFRPNIVVAGTPAWAEDRWRRIRIGAVTLRIARACSRCIVTTQQPDTGERHDANEPLTTLKALGRATRSGIMFGQNAIPDGPGTIRVGDTVEILEEGESNLPA